MGIITLGFFFVWTIIVSTAGMSRYIDVFRSIPNLSLPRDVFTILASFMEEPNVTTVVSSKDGLDAPNGVAVDQDAGCLCM